MNFMLTRRMRERQPRLTSPLTFSLLLSQVAAHQQEGLVALDLQTRQPCRPPTLDLALLRLQAEIHSFEDPGFFTGSDSHSTSPLANVKMDYDPMVMDTEPSGPSVKITE